VIVSEDTIMCQAARVSVGSFQTSFLRFSYVRLVRNLSHRILSADGCRRYILSSRRLVIS
jgi:hypothetical protein